MKLQLEKELKTKIFSNLRNKYMNLILNNYISIMTYQSLEERLKKGEAQSLYCELYRYQYIVYDECHYFISDSTFNTSTAISYTFLTDYFDYCRVDMPLTRHTPLRIRTCGFPASGSL